MSDRVVAANGVDFTVLEAGTGPLALCLHGFPDSAHTWRHLLPALAEGGFRAAAPFMRGYAPTTVPADGRYGLGALVADAVALHEALGGDERAVLIGHDWGAEAAYGAAAHAPERWATVVGLAVPPASLNARLFGDYEQLKRFFYMFLFQTAIAEVVAAADDLAFVDRLWADWSPGFDGADALAEAKASIRAPENLGAAIGYYRAALSGGGPDDPFAAEQRAALAATPPQPGLYLHGADDGCVAVDLVRDAADHLAPGSRMEVIEGAGHFLHLERPAEVNALVLDWVGARSAG